MRGRIPKKSKLYKLIFYLKTFETSPKYGKIAMPTSKPLSIIYFKTLNTFSFALSLFSSFKVSIEYKISSKYSLASLSKILSGILFISFIVDLIVIFWFIDAFAVLLFTELL